MFSSITVVVRPANSFIPTVMLHRESFFGSLASVVVIDVNGPQPIVTPTVISINSATMRSATLLADDSTR